MDIEFSHVFSATGITGDGARFPIFQGNAGPIRPMQQLEAAGISRVILDGGNNDLVRSIFGATHDLHVVLAHAPGDQDPVAAARAIGELARIGHGRLELAMRPPAFGAESIAARLDQLGEYATLLKRLWLSDKPFEHQGAHYTIAGASCSEAAAVPIRMAGRSGLAQKIAGQLADIYEVAPGPLHDVIATVERVRHFAGERGRARAIRFALPVAVTPCSSGKGVALPGAPLQDALHLLDFIEAGVEEFTVHGDLQSACRFARDVLPLVRNSVARRQGRAQMVRRGPDRASWA